jgi:hypothetical protein
MQPLIGALLLAAAAPPSPGRPTPGCAGVYEINQMEMAGGLELRADGRFRYALEYGAVSETAEGVWTSASNGVHLTTNPMPKSSECDRGFGSACFDRTPLALEDGNLILRRWDARIILRPVQGRPSK